MQKKLKIAVIIPSLGCGGAERVCAGLANFLSRQNQVSLITFTTQAPFFPLENAVEQLSLESKRLGATIFSALHLLPKLRRKISRLAPDVIVSFLARTNLLVLSCTLGLGIPVIVAERTNPKTHPPGKHWMILRELLYPLARRVIVQSEYVKHSFSKRLQRKIEIIPNPLLLDLNQGPGARSLSARPTMLVAAGRLLREKGFDLLLQALAIARRSIPELKLTIWGDGKERGNLERLARELSIETAVTWAGTSKEMASALRAGDIFVLPSRLEGFPNALLEAMALGVPAVAFNCPGGVAELTKNGSAALLSQAENTSDFAAQIVRLIQDEKLRVALSERGLGRAENFMPQEIFGRWATLIEKITMPVNRT